MNNTWPVLGSMCTICDAWNLKKIDSKKAFQEIDQALKNSKDQKMVQHLSKLSETIISIEVPDVAADEELEELWAKENKR